MSPALGAVDGRDPSAAEVTDADLLAAHAAGDPDADIPEVVFVEGNTDEIAEQRTKGVLAFDPDVIFSPLPKPERKGSVKQADRELFEAKIKGVAQILDAYGVFEDMTYAKQQELLRAIVAVFASGD